MDDAGQPRWHVARQLDTFVVQGLAIGLGCPVRVSCWVIALERDAPVKLAPGAIGLDGDESDVEKDPRESGGEDRVARAPQRFVLGADEGAFPVRRNVLAQLRHGVGPQKLSAHDGIRTVCTYQNPTAGAGAVGEENCHARRVLRVREQTLVRGDLQMSSEMAAKQVTFRTEEETWLLVGDAAEFGECVARLAVQEAEGIGLAWPPQFALVSRMSPKSSGRYCCRSGMALVCGYYVSRCIGEQRNVVRDQMCTLTPSVPLPNLVASS